MAEDAHAVEINPLVQRCELLDADLFVSQRVVPHVVVAEALIRVGAQRVAAAVAELDDDEAQLCELLRHPTGGEWNVHALGLRPRIDVRDDRILLRGVEVERLPHVAVNVGDAVGGFHDELLGRFPSGGLDAGEVGLLEIHHGLAERIAQYRLGCILNARGVVDDELLARTERCGVVRVARIEQCEASAVAIHAIRVPVVHVFARLPAHT